MVGPVRPQFVLFGSSIVQLSFSNGGWGSILSEIYARKIYFCEDTMAGTLGMLFRSLTKFFQSIVFSLLQNAAIQPSLVIGYFGGGNDLMGLHSSGLDRDRVHLSAEGSKIVVQEIHKVLMEAEFTLEMHAD
ncbi:hypothetical protein LguiA_023782 [Lonicera macranthoides]